MKANKAALLLTLLLAVAGASQARNETQAADSLRSLSLEDAISLSLKASKQLRVSEARQAEAEAGLKEARERRLPDLKLSAAYLRLASPDIDLKLNTSKQEQGGQSGTTEQQGGGMPSINEAAYAMANASLPLFTGFKIQSGIESAKYLAKAAQLDAAHDQEAVILNTVDAYINLYKAKAAVALMQENLNTANQRVRDMKNLEENGLLARNDLLKATLQASKVELSLLDAQSNLHLANVNMDLMLGLPEGTQLKPDTHFSSTPDRKPLSDWESLAFANRKDRASMENQALAAQSGVRAAKGDYYPSLALTGGYIGAYVPNILTIKDALNAGLGLSYSPSSLWKAGAKVAGAKARLAEALAGQALLDDGIRMQVTRAYEGWLLSEKKIDVYEDAVEQAEENYRIVKNKNANALATTTELLDADVAQLEARLNHAFAQADAVAAYKKLLNAAGLLGNIQAQSAQ
ncbi:MAG: TolC family protein [Bacteroidetes bacterium]|nr:TolC family protein [Bacteroidota bacterium]